jgi:hypothetical protein
MPCRNGVRGRQGTRILWWKYYTPQVTAAKRVNEKFSHLVLPIDRFVPAFERFVLYPEFPRQWPELSQHVFCSGDATKTRS